MAKSSIHIIPDVTGNETNDSPSITFDVVTSFTPQRSRTVTKSPVSKGSFISELLSNQGGRVILEAYVSNNPVIITPQNLIDSTKADVRTKAAYLALDKLYKSNNTVTIVYDYDTLNSYFLTNFEPIIMPSDSIGFRLEFDEVRFVSEKRVQLIVNMSDIKAKDSAVPANKGTTTKKEVNDLATLKKIEEEYGLLGKLTAETFITLGGTL